jgi:DNA-binding LacI/PurR family transcriptional regulator
MTAAGLPVTVIRTGMSPAEADATIADLIRSPDRPTAVVAGSDVLAAACYAQASRTGLRIGKDLGVTGFDGSTVARILTPALTTVAMPLAEVASRLVERIVSAVDGVSQESGDVLATNLIWGESVLPRARGRRRGRFAP